MTVADAPSATDPVFSQEDVEAAADAIHAALHGGHGCSAGVSAMLHAADGTRTSFHRSEPGLCASFQQARSLAAAALGCPAVREAVEAQRPKSWPYTTPSGHTYQTPKGWVALNNRCVDSAQGWMEHWDEPEMPPEPTWEMVGLALQELARLAAALARVEAVLTRDYASSSELEAALRAALAGEREDDGA